MPKQPPENPLKGKNIPPAPPVESKTVSGFQGNPVEGDKGNMAESYQSNTVERQTVVPLSKNEEKATIELSLYLRQRQDDKLEELRQAYRKRTGKKITANELMRRLIDNATLDHILDEL